MGSFIDLTASDIWSDADIKSRSQAILRSVFSKERESQVIRNITCSQAGLYTLTDEEKADIELYKKTSFLIKESIDSATKDRDLLLQVIPVESAYRRIMLEVKSEGYSEEEIAIDQEERLEAQSIIESASDEVKSVVKLRNPDINIENSESLPEVDNTNTEIHVLIETTIVPEQIEKWKAKKLLNSKIVTDTDGSEKTLYSIILEMFDRIDDETQKNNALIDFNDAMYYRRDNLTLKQAQWFFSISDETMDQWFIEASQIS